MNVFYPRPDAHIDPKNYRMVVLTQYRENYGAHAWDGEGECPQYWKSKGGNHVTLAHITQEDVIDLGHSGLDSLASQLTQIFSPLLESNDDYSQEWVIGWDLIPPGEELPEEEWDREWMESIHRRIAEG